MLDLVYISQANLLAYEMLARILKKVWAMLGLACVSLAEFLACKTLARTLMLN